MHFLVLGINYTPEQTSVAPFTTGVCDHLVAQGHQVSVVTAFPYYPEWRIRKEYRGRLWARETINGVSVRRVWHYVPRRPRGLIERLLHDITFSVHAAVRAFAVRDVDAIFCSSPPPFTPLAAWLHSRLRGVPYAVKVTDLATNAALSTGIMSDGALVKLARALEQFNYDKAAGVLLPSDGFKDSLIRLGSPTARLFVVPDWADTVQVTPRPRTNEVRRRLGYADSDFVLVHAGNIGLKQNLETVVDAAAAAAAPYPSIKWLIVGDGEDRSRLEQMVRDRGIANVQFAGLLPKEELPLALASANALILTQLAPVTDSVIPSKLLTYMASGRAVIASVNSASEAAVRLGQAGCGIVVAPEDPLALLEAAVRLMRMGDAADDFGRRGRAYVEARFSKAAALARYDAFFDAVFPGTWANRPAVMTDTPSVKEQR